MKRRITLAVLVAAILLLTTVAVADSYITETLRDRHGNTWTVRGIWGELDGLRVFYPQPPNGKIWVDTSRMEIIRQKVPRTETITVRDTLYTPTATISQKAVGDHRVVLHVNNPNYFDVKAHIELKSLSPDEEALEFEVQREENVVLSPGKNDIIFDSAKRHEGMTSYEVTIRVVENLHPNIHPDYSVVRGVGKHYPELPLYIAFLKPEVTLNSNNASTESAFGTNWTVRNPNTIDFDYKIEIEDARGKREIQTGRLAPGQMINGFESGIPSKDSTNTQTITATLDPEHENPKVNNASFTFVIAPATISLSPSYSDAPMETEVRQEPTGCAYGPNTHAVTYQWNGANYTVNSTVTNNSNIPITVTAEVDGNSATYNLGPYGSTAGPVVSGQTRDPYTVNASTRWHTHTSSNSTTIPVKGWVEIARESFTCNPPPPEED